MCVGRFWRSSGSWQWADRHCVLGNTLR